MKLVGIVQYQKHVSYHTTHGMTPFEAIFNSKPPIGITELGIPDVPLCNLLTEEDLDWITQEMNQTEQQGFHYVPESS